MHDRRYHHHAPIERRRWIQDTSSHGDRSREASVAKQRIRQRNAAGPPQENLDSGRERAGDDAGKYRDPEIDHLPDVQDSLPECLGRCTESRPIGLVDSQSMLSYRSPSVSPADALRRGSLLFVTVPSP
jgi:hypothetical protein